MFAQNLIGFHPDGMKLLWKKKLNSEFRVLCADFDVLYFILDNKRVGALKIKTGDIVWTKELPDSNRRNSVWLNGLLANHEIVLLNSEGNIVSFNAKNGDEGINRNLKIGKTYSDFAIADSSLYIMDSSGNVLEFS